MANQSNTGADQTPESGTDPFARTGRDRASLVERDYFRERPPLDRWKARLGWLGFVLPIPILAATFFVPNGDRVYSRGPVANVHAAWDDSCDRCHEPFRAINENTWFSWHGHAGRLRNEKCIGCHAAPVHVTNEKEASVANCGGCHREHLGREASLTRLPDFDCTRCHRTLPEHRTGEPLYATMERVTSFVTDHPEFRYLDTTRTDLPKGKYPFQPPARTLKFSHVYHLLPGMDITQNSKRKPQTYKNFPKVAERTSITYGELPGGERQRYWLMDPANKDQTPVPADMTQPVQLDCVACHQLDGQDPDRLRSTQVGAVPRGTFPARMAGAYMLPINFETHCKACHPLNDFNLNPLFRDQEVPHRIQPTEVKAFVQRLLVDQAIEEVTGQKGNPKAGSETFNPFERLDALDAARAKTVAGLVKTRLEAATKDLFLGGRSCGKCHEYQDGDYNKKIMPMSTPSIWFEHARFKHVSHRSMDCKVCHKMPAWSPDTTAGALQAPPAEKEKLLIEGIALCRDCHQPLTTVNGKQRGGARFDCTECHGYHTGDFSKNPHLLRQGIGSRERDPAVRMTLEELLAPTGKATSAPK